MPTLPPHCKIYIDSNRLYNCLAYTTISYFCIHRGLYPMWRPRGWVWQLRSELGFLSGLFKTLIFHIFGFVFSLPAHGNVTSTPGMRNSNSSITTYKHKYELRLLNILSIFLSVLFASILAFWHCKA